jgi:enterochelin esterase-like enzyme
MSPGTAGGGGSGGYDSGAAGEISETTDAAVDLGSDGGFASVDTGGTDATDGASSDVSGPESRPDAGTVVDPGKEGDGMRTVPQPFKAAPETKSQAGVPHGSRIKFTMARGTSQRYPNAVDREVNVYVPAQYVSGTPAPVIVVQDGNNFYGFVDLLSNTLDNLIAANKLPPIVAVYANNGGGDAQGSERGKEYDTLSGVYAEWVDRELLPQVEQQTLKQLPAKAVTFTKDPEGRGALGGSSGGVASFIMAWYHPDLFRRVIGYSPSFVAQESPKNPDHPLGAWNFHEDDNMDSGGIIAKTSPSKPIRAWLECGTKDNGAGTALVANTPYPHYDFYYAVTRTGEKLAAKGYHVHTDVGQGAGHVDGGMVQATLPEAVLWAWRGYQPAR